MSFVVLFVLVFLNGQPQADFRVYQDMTKCNAVKAEVIKDSIVAGVTIGSVTCTEHQVGTFS